MKAALLFVLGVLGAAHGEVHLSGRVTNENGVGLAGARVGLHAPATAVDADASGTFHLTAPGPGAYRISVELRGYFPVRRREITLNEGANEIALEMIALRTVQESVDVIAPSPDVQIVSAPVTLAAEQILAVPVPGDYNFRNTLRALPGVVQDRRGRIHIDGGADDQLQYTLDGFTVNDPITGRFDSQVSVDSIRSLDLYSGRFSAEYGKGSAGTLAIRGNTGDDQWRSSATNFIPAFEHRKGLSIGSWLPRVGVSGPIARGSAWFSNTSDAQYEQFVVEEIRQGLDRMHSWRLSNMTRAQVYLTPTNILQSGLLVSWWDAPNQGLSILDPPETTLDRRTRQWFLNLKDQIYFANGAMIEFGFAANRTRSRELPQGDAGYIVMPGGRAGNHFLTAARQGGRDQTLMNLILPQFNWLGAHQVKAGVDFDRVAYWQDVHRTSVEFRGVESVLLRRVSYFGGRAFQGTNREAAGYVQDTWRVRPNLTAELGLREDWDRLVDRPSVSPRLGLAWSPRAGSSTKIAGGFGVVHDATSLRLFTRPLDQYSLITYFNREGAITRGPAANVYIRGERAPRSPRYQSWTLGVEQMLPGRMLVSAHYLRKRTTTGFTYRNLISGSNPDYDGIYALSNDRRDRYDALELKVRRSFRKYEWSAGYTRSRAQSNAVVDLNVDDPIIITDNVGPMPWDAPHRAVSSGLLPTLWKDWSIAYLVEYRTGLPFSIQDAEGRLRGQVNGFRFPAFLECNLHVERAYQLGGRRWALRFGFNNLFDRANPVIVDNNMGSPRFLSFYGGLGRAFTVRLRLLGR